MTHFLFHALTFADQATDATSTVFSGFFGIVLFAGAVLGVVSYWRIFEKAGRPGWLALIPIVNYFVLLRIVGQSPWWLLLLLVPGVDVVFIFVFSIVIFWDLGRSFGKGAGFRLGLIFLHFIFAPLLAFDNSTYLGARPSVTPVLVTTR